MCLLLLIRSGFFLGCCISFDPNLIVSVSGERNALAQHTNLTNIGKKAPENSSMLTIFSDHFSFLDVSCAGASAMKTANYNMFSSEKCLRKSADDGFIVACNALFIFHLFVFDSLFAWFSFWHATCLLLKLLCDTRAHTTTAPIEVHSFFIGKLWMILSNWDSEWGPDWHLWSEYPVNVKRHRSNFWGGLFSS